MRENWATYKESMHVFGTIYKSPSWCSITVLLAAPPCIFAFKNHNGAHFGHLYEIQYKLKKQNHVSYVMATAYPKSAARMNIPRDLSVPSVQCLIFIVLVGLTLVQMF